MLKTERFGNLRGRYVVTSPWRPLTPDREGPTVAKTAQEWNQPEHIKAFIDRASLYTIGLDGTNIHFTVSDTPYTDKHIMLVLENPEMIHRERWDEGLIIHDQKPEERLLYWNTALITLDQFTRNLNGGGDAIVFTENTCNHVTNGEERIPRSIGLVHGHVTRFSREQMEDFGYIPEEDVARMQDEIQLWSRTGTDFVAKVNNEMPPETNIHFKQRAQELPPGYETEMRYHGPGTRAAKKVDQVLKSHHLAYTQVVGRMDQRVVKPQPSYRTYLELDLSDEVLRAGISPIFVSHAGSITASGIFTNRIQDPNYPIEERRRNDARMIVKEIGDQVYQDMRSNGHPAEVLRSDYPY